jgi:uncharacterized membrane protein
MFVLPGAIHAQETSVHGVLFFSPTCGHCRIVMEEILPPLQDQYGDRLVLMLIDVTNAEGNSLFRQAIDQFKIPSERQGVPMLIVGEVILVGSSEIPNLLPSIIVSGLAQGGIPWPELDGLPLSQPDGIEIAGKPGILETFNRDRAANIFSVIVLAGMVLSVLWIGSAFLQSKPFPMVSWPAWLIPVLSIGGLIISAYLSYIEVTQTEAFCGPIGDCNAVQSSSYARLFGWIPIGVLGLVGYLAILTAWLFQFSTARSHRELALSFSWYLALAGMLFSIYLTFLEPFVIGATCIWCISSAFIMTCLFWATSGPAFGRMRRGASFRKQYQVISRKKV